ncbi:LysM peptidoglycan-binding domain-containing protein [Halalkalibacillus sediminis]|nr:LysM peptidoglycan-binding domain-containing protein [Halalkalibacillus sediminis]
MKIHVVKKNETLASVAEKYDITLDEILGMNQQISSPESLMAGMKLKVPNKEVQLEPVISSNSERNHSSEKETYNTSGKHFRQYAPEIREDEHVFLDKTIQPYDQATHEDWLHQSWYGQPGAYIPDNNSGNMPEDYVPYQLNYYYQPSEPYRGYYPYYYNPCTGTPYHY